jgi:hypothetical protein
MVSAILYVEVADGATGAFERLEFMSLGNCKQLFHRFSTGEVILQVTCNDAKSLNTAIAEFAAVEGVTRVMTCVVRSS